MRPRDLDERRVGHARMHATRWPGGCSSSGGTADGALGRSRSGQRSRNAQPLGSRVRLGHLPRNRLEAIAARAERRHRAQQRLRVRVQRAREELVDRRVLDDAPGVHDGDLVRLLGDDAEVVRDEERRPCRGARAARAAASRISAWIVTSSAVVGSSAMQQRGLARDRHRDHDALAHAARELVRVVVRASLRRRECRPRASSSMARAQACRARHGPGAGAPPRRPGCPPSAPDSARSSAPGRSSRCARRARRASRARAAPSRSRSVEEHAAAGDPSRAAGTRRMSDSAVMLLPHPDSPTRPRTSPRSSVKRHAVDGARLAGVGGEDHAQVADVEERHHPVAAASSGSTRGADGGENAVVVERRRWARRRRTPAARTSRRRGAETSRRAGSRRW